MKLQQWFKSLIGKKIVKNKVETVHVKDHDHADFLFYSQHDGHKYEEEIEDDTASNIAAGIALSDMLSNSDNVDFGCSVPTENTPTFEGFGGGDFGGGGSGGSWDDSSSSTSDSSSYSDNSSSYSDTSTSSDF